MTSQDDQKGKRKNCGLNLFIVLIRLSCSSPTPHAVRIYNASDPSEPHSARPPLEAPEGVAEYAAEGGLVRAFFRLWRKKVGEVRRESEKKNLTTFRRTR